MTGIIIISIILMLAILALTVLAISSGYKHEAMNKQEMDPIPPHLEALAKQNRKEIEQKTDTKEQ